MEKMTIKEAQEIINRKRPFTPFFYASQEAFVLGYANGFIEGHDSREVEVQELKKEIEKWHNIASALQKELDLIELDKLEEPE